MPSQGPPKIAVVAPTSNSGETGGAERLLEGLCGALSDFGFASTLVTRVIESSDFQGVLAAYLMFHDLNLDEFDAVISTKAPSYAIRHRNHVCYLVHTMRTYYDMFDWERLRPTEEQLQQRQFIQQLDSRLLSSKRIKFLYSIGSEVSERLRFYNSCQAPYLRCPTTLTDLREGNFEYLFLPGRLHRWKRVDLAIDALLASGISRQLVVAGDGEDAENFRRRASGDPRIIFTGRVSEGDLCDLYANALAVIFVPRSEDLGLVTYEAFLAGKPVITCHDSGEPARLVRHGVSGYVVAPDAESIAACVRQLVANPSLASAMGAAGRSSISETTWQGVAQRLVVALGFAAYV